MEEIGNKINRALSGEGWCIRASQGAQMERRCGRPSLARNTPSRAVNKEKDLKPGETDNRKKQRRQAWWK